MILKFLLLAVFAGTVVGVGLYMVENKLLPWLKNRNK